MFYYVYLLHVYIMFIFVVFVLNYINGRKKKVKIKQQTNKRNPAMMSSAHHGQRDSRRNLSIT